MNGKRITDRGGVGDLGFEVLSFLELYKGRNRRPGFGHRPCVIRELSVVSDLLGYDVTETSFIVV